MPSSSAAPPATPETPPQSCLRDAARHEPSLLHTSQAAAWAGFRLGIFRAGTLEVTAQQGEHPVVAMILKGRTRGRIVSRGDDCDFSPGPDSVGLFGPRFEVDWSRWEAEPGAERMVVELDFSGLERAGDLEAMLPARRELQQNLTLQDRELATLMRLVAAEVRQGSPHGALYASSLSLGLAAYLFGQHASGGHPRSRERGTLTAAQKRAVLELVEQRLGEELSLDELAGAAGVSRYHFLRLFKNSLGVTPHRFVLDRRVAAARQLLETTRLPLAEIAAATGFASQSHMSTTMRRHLGLPPGMWRRTRPA
jgi:AraC family transcriptional regulator